MMKFALLGGAVAAVTLLAAAYLFDERPALAVLTGAVLIYGSLVIGDRYGPARTGPRFGSREKGGYTALQIACVLLVFGGLTAWFLWQLFGPTDMPRPSGVAAGAIGLLAGMTLWFILNIRKWARYE
jgi:hypothetical protein